MAERYNVTANVLTNDGGGVYSPPVNLSSFAAWCIQLGCHAIIQLPTEIASPSTAAFEVAYTEQVVRFIPDYWEIGNEPTTWTHFGIPWSQWNASQNYNATPLAFASLVGRAPTRSIASTQMRS